MKIHHQLGRFALVGTVGFVADGGLLSLLHHGMALDLVPARLISFLFAVTVTWALNRRFTFADSTSHRKTSEWFSYTLVNSVGALINLAIFFFLIFGLGWFVNLPILALAVASLVAMGFNFFASKWLVFHH